jgi:NADPH:quinone reductase-like Zn-dependent oxidoreductase
MMRAVAVPGFGSAPELIELPRPGPGPGELLVRLAAAGVNPMDWKIAGGELDGRMPHTFPLVVGVDGAGTVETVGEGVTRFAPGDAVYGQFFRSPLGTGTYAGYVVAPEEMETGAVHRIPEGVTESLAAAAPTAGMTALGVVSEVGATEGQTVLIVGATGGVGSFATQLAAARGARVIATSRPDADAWIRGLGAAETVDYAEAPIGEQVRAACPGGVDVLLDLVSGVPTFAEHAALVREGGSAASIVFAADPDALRARGIRGSNYLVQGKAELLRRLTAEIEAGRLRIPVESEVPLDGAIAALARSRAGGARGKTVIRT